ncbi:hypothetical protein SLS59_007262 [Nothophoma quercina]|uniref:Uncharacterized protein n=1 Tax=Nothophoma quercina TaxID=749835 RepID=A0ABR3QZH2_9PLEO
MSSDETYVAPAAATPQNGDKNKLNRRDSFADDMLTEASELGRPNIVQKRSTFFDGCTFTLSTSPDNRTLNPSGLASTASAPLSNATYLHHFAPPAAINPDVDLKVTMAKPSRLPLWHLNPKSISRRTRIRYWIKSVLAEADPVSTIKRADDKENDALTYVWAETEKTYKTAGERARSDKMEAKRSKRNWRRARWECRYWRAREMLERVIWWRKRADPGDIPSV